MTTLWSRIGSTGKPVLIANTDKTAIVECTVCPCYEMSVVISCPEYLHLLGGPKTLTITVTYSKPPLSSPPLPAVYITEKDSFPAMVCNTCMVVDENQTNAWLDFTEGGGQWSGAPGDDTRTWSHSILAVGLPTNAGTDNTGFVVVEAFHPTKVDENDEPVSVTETPCEIELSNVVHCSVNMPEDVCTEDKFTITIRPPTGTVSRLFVWTERITRSCLSVLHIVSVSPLRAITLLRMVCPPSPLG